jgi:two-component system LytT family sensor kinase
MFFWAYCYRKICVEVSIVDVVFVGSVCVLVVFPVVVSKKPSGFLKLKRCSVFFCGNLFFDVCMVYANCRMRMVNGNTQMKKGLFYIRLLMRREFLLHMLCWLLFIAYELGFVYYISRQFAPLVSYIFYYGVNISFFYTHLRLLTNSFNRKVPAWRMGLLLFAAEIAVFMVIKVICDMVLAPPPSTFNQRLQYAGNFIPLDLIRCIYFCLLSTFYWAGGHITFSRRLVAESERQQLLADMQKAEMEGRLAASRNAFLQQQLNPHMLFNALSFVYSSVYKTSADAARCIWLLSEIMRFCLEAAGADEKTSLEAEASQLEHLLEINRYRFEGAMFISVEMQGDFSRSRIIPLVLLTLTENIFKHGDLRDEASPALLRIGLDDNGLLTYYSLNRKKAKNAPGLLNHNGLQNVRTRLEYAYPALYTFNIDETVTDFALTLKLQL